MLEKHCCDFYRRPVYCENRAKHSTLVNDCHTDHIDWDHRGSTAHLVDTHYEKCSWRFSTWGLGTFIALANR